MSQGYSQRFIARNREADGKSLGVALGRVCIKYDVPVIAVAKADDEPVAEPAKRASKKQAEVSDAPKKSLADVVNDWSSDD